WLLVWAIGKLPPAALMGVMSLTLLLAIGAVGTLLVSNAPVALALAVVAAVLIAALVWRQKTSVQTPDERGTRQAAATPGGSPAWGGVLLLSGALVLGGVLVSEARV